MKKALMLIEVSPYQAKDGTTKYKHLFLDSENKALSGFSDSNKFASQVKDLEFFDPEYAREWEVQRSEFDGKLRLRVVIP